MIIMAAAPRHSTLVWVHYDPVAAAGRQPACPVWPSAPRFGCIMIIVATAGCQPAACLACFVTRFARHDHYGPAGCQGPVWHYPRHSTPVAALWPLRAASPHPVHCGLAVCPSQHPGLGASLWSLQPGVWARHDHCGHCGLPARSLFGHIPRHSTPVWVHQ